MIKINEEKEIETFAGIADNKGIDMLMPFESLKSLVKIGMQARAISNEHRNAVYFEAKLLKSDGYKILNMLKKGSDVDNPHKAALNQLREAAIEVKFEKGKEVYWKQL